MPLTNLERLRRFALTIALVLLTFSLAGVELEADARVTPFGLPFRISRPDLLPVGLMVAAFYAMGRFYYYGMMLGPSPYASRRELLIRTRRDYRKKAKAKPGRGRRARWTYWGPPNLVTSPWTSDPNEAERLAERLRESFPKFARRRVRAEVRGEQSVTPEGDEFISYAVFIDLPLRCRLASFIQDVDYSAPVWLNAVALIFAARAFFIS